MDSMEQEGSKMGTEMTPEMIRRREMHTVMTTNNGFDSILLVTDSDEVVSAWTADLRAVEDYLEDGADADTWAVNEWEPGWEPERGNEELRRIESYGREIGRDGKIEDERRREYWTVRLELAAQRRARRGELAITRGVR